MYRVHHPGIDRTVHRPAAKLLGTLQYVPFADERLFSSGIGEEGSVRLYQAFFAVV